MEWARTRGRQQKIRNGGGGKITRTEVACASHQYGSFLLVGGLLCSENTSDEHGFAPPFWCL